MTDKDLVIVADYDPKWPGIFEQERTELATALHDQDVSIVHTGSTAIPGLAAKPIIDILIEAPVLPTPPLQSWTREESSRSIDFARALTVSQYVPTYDVNDGKVFYKKQEPRFNLWVFLTGDLRAQDLVLFRDYLITHPARAREYQELKVRLALEHPTDLATYTLAKIAFVGRTLELAREAGAES